MLLQLIDASSLSYLSRLPIFFFIIIFFVIQISLCGSTEVQAYPLPDISDLNNSMDTQTKFSNPETMIKYSPRRTLTHENVCISNGHSYHLHSSRMSYNNQMLPNIPMSQPTALESPNVTTYHAINVGGSISSFNSAFKESSSVNTVISSKQNSSKPVVSHLNFSVSNSIAVPYTSVGSVPEKSIIEQPFLKTEFSCSKCIESFSSSQELSEHFFRIHAGKFKCPDCYFAFHEEHKLNEHVNITHVKLKPFQCIECESKFCQKNALKEHIENVHRKLAFKCSHCSATFLKMSQLNKHLKEVHPIACEASYKCSECSQIFKKKQDMQTHMKKIHSILKETNKKHLKTNVDLLPNTKRERGRPRKVRGRNCKKTFKCEECNKNLSSKQDLKIHQEEMHFEVFHCPECEFADFEVDALTSHMVDKHFENNLFECLNCHSSFSTESSLELHKSQCCHKNIEEYTCVHCNMSFTKECNFIDHYHKEHSDIDSSTVNNASFNLENSSSENNCKKCGDLIKNPKCCSCVSKENATSTTDENGLDFDTNPGCNDDIICHNCSTGEEKDPEMLVITVTCPSVENNILCPKVLEVRPDNINVDPSTINSDNR